MCKRLVALLVVVIVMVSACSTNSSKRLAYETLQNVREQECQKDRSSDCQSRESYDAYQTKRIALEPSRK